MSPIPNSRSFVLRVGLFIEEEEAPERLAESDGGVLGGALIKDAHGKSDDIPRKGPAFTFSEDVLARTGFQIMI